VALVQVPHRGNEGDGLPTGPQGFSAGLHGWDVADDFDGCTSGFDQIAELNQSG
jgi:hypothetical protein